MINIIEIKNLMLKINELKRWKPVARKLVSGLDTNSDILTLELKKNIFTFSRIIPKQRLIWILKKIFNEKKIFLWNLFSPDINNDNSWDLIITLEILVLFNKLSDDKNASIKKNLINLYKKSNAPAELVFILQKILFNTKETKPEPTINFLKAKNISENLFFNGYTDFSNTAFNSILHIFTLPQVDYFFQNNSVIEKNKYEKNLEIYSQNWDFLSYIHKISFASELTKSLWVSIYKNDETSFKKTYIKYGHILGECITKPDITSKIGTRILYYYSILLCFHLILKKAFHKSFNNIIVLDDINSCLIHDISNLSRNRFSYSYGETDKTKEETIKKITLFLENFYLEYKFIFKFSTSIFSKKYKNNKYDELKNTPVMSIMTRSLNILPEWITQINNISTSFKPEFKHTPESIYKKGITDIIIKNSPFTSTFNYPFPKICLADKLYFYWKYNHSLTSINLDINQCITLNNSSYYNNSIFKCRIMDYLQKIKMTSNPNIKKDLHLLIGSLYLNVFIYYLKDKQTFFNSLKKYALLKCIKRTINHLNKSKIYISEMDFLKKLFNYCIDLKKSNLSELLFFKNHFNDKKNDFTNKIIALFDIRFNELLSDENLEKLISKYNFAFTKINQKIITKNVDNHKLGIFQLFSVKSQFFKETLLKKIKITFIKSNFAALACSPILLFVQTKIEINLNKIMISQILIYLTVACCTYFITFKNTIRTANIILPALIFSFANTLMYYIILSFGMVPNSAMNLIIKFNSLNILKMNIFIFFIWEKLTLLITLFQLFLNKSNTSSEI